MLRPILVLPRIAVSYLADPAVVARGLRERTYVLGMFIVAVLFQHPLAV